MVNRIPRSNDKNKDIETILVIRILFISIRGLISVIIKRSVGIISKIIWVLEEEFTEKEKPPSIIHSIKHSGLFSKIFILYSCLFRIFFVLKG